MKTEYWPIFAIGGFLIGAGGAFSTGIELVLHIVVGVGLLGYGLKLRRAHNKKTTSS